jgi:RnfABCDGE-type electron transport complex G subunit
MNLSTKMIVVLTSVGLISGGLLSVVGLLTKERIELNKQQEIEEAIISVVPGTETSEMLYEEENLTIYGARDGQNNFLGYAVYARGTGFQDIIALMVGTNAEITKINSLKIIEQKETPGLGAKIEDKNAFLQFWENKDCSGDLTLRKPAVSSPEDLASTEVNTITGATISSQKVLEIVNLSLDQLKKLKAEGELGSEK